MELPDNVERVGKYNFRRKDIPALEVIRKSPVEFEVRAILKHRPFKTQTFAICKSEELAIKSLMKINIVDNELRFG